MADFIDVSKPKPKPSDCKLGAAIGFALENSLVAASTTDGLLDCAKMFCKITPPFFRDKPTYTQCFVRVLA